MGLPALPQTKQVPQLLQGLLNQNRLADAKVSYEVLNFSVSSAGTANEYLRYMLDARRFNPDVVLVYFTVSNDMRNNSVLLQPLCEAASIDLPGFVLDKDHKLQQVTIPAAPGSYVYYRSPLAHWLVQRSALYRRATRALQVLKGARSAVSPPAQWAITVSFLQQPYTPAVADAWNVTEALLCALREEAAKDRARVGVVLIPTAWDIELAWKEWLLQQLPPTLTTASLDFDLPYNEAIRRLTRWHIPVLDLRTPFRKALRDAPTELLYDTT